MHIHKIVLEIIYKRISTWKTIKMTNDYWLPTRVQYLYPVKGQKKKSIIWNLCCSTQFSHCKKRITAKNLRNKIQYTQEKKRPFPILEAVGPINIKNSLLCSVYRGLHTYRRKKIKFEPLNIVNPGRQKT
jgi:hypothetical protein